MKKHMIVAAGRRTVTNDEFMQLTSLNCAVQQHAVVKTSIESIIQRAYGLVIFPGWEEDPDVVLQVQVAKAFGVPVKTHLRWLMTLPAPADPNEYTTDIETGEVIHAWDTFGDTVELINLEEHTPPPTTPPKISAGQCYDGGHHAWIVQDDGSTGCPGCGAVA